MKQAYIIDGIRTFCKNKRGALHYLFLKVCTTFIFALTHHAPLRIIHTAKDLNQYLQFQVERRAIYVSLSSL